MFADAGEEGRRRLTVTKKCEREAALREARYLQTKRSCNKHLVWEARLLLTIRTQALEGIPIMSFLDVHTDAGVKAGTPAARVHLLTVAADVAITTLALEMLLQERVQRKMCIVMLKSLPLLIPKLC